MTGLQLVVDVDARASTAMLAGIGRRLEDPTALLRLLAGDIRDYERATFASAGNGTWAPDDPATVALKGSSRTLVNTGGLLDALSSPGGENIERVTGETVSVGTAHQAAAFLQRGNRGMPKRNPAPAPPADVVQGWGEGLLMYVVTGRRP